jgi:hypothetical protein
MSMHGTHHRAALRRCLVALVAGVAGSGLIGAAAAVITDPTNSIEVTTNGEPSSAYLAAVSDGGSADSTGVAVTVGSGAANSQNLAISTAGPATACGGHVPASVSEPYQGGAYACAASPIEDPSGLNLWGVGLDCAGGAYVAVGWGCAGSSQGAAASVTGLASGRTSAVSAEGDATSGSLAVSGTGTAYACGGPLPVAASTGPSSSCRGTAVPVGAHEGGLSMNGG